MNKYVCLFNNPDNLKIMAFIVVQYFRIVDHNCMMQKRMTFT